MSRLSYHLGFVLYRGDLEEAVISFFPSSSRDREEIIFDLMQRF
jgi:hypothetical protein